MPLAARAASSTWVMGYQGSGPAVTDVMAGVGLERVIVTPDWADGVDLVPGGSAPIKPTGARRLRDSLAALDPARYDALLLDCPPTLGGPTIGALTAARHALIVVDPSALGLRGIGAVADAVDDAWQDANPDLDLCGVVVNRMPAVSAEAERRLAELGRIVGSSTVWKPPIPQRVIVNQALGERRPIHSYGSRAADVTAAFDKLWTKLRRTVRS